MELSSSLAVHGTANFNIIHGDFNQHNQNGPENVDWLEQVMGTIRQHITPATFSGFSGPRNPSNNASGENDHEAVLGDMMAWLQVQYWDTTRKHVMNVLQEHFASGALHDSAERGNPPKCHPDTRTAILKRIMDWLKSPSNERLFFWLFGPAGAGKTAIAETIAEMAQQLKLLAATFFFSRSAAKRNTKRFLIVTLAYQLAQFIPEMTPCLKNSLDKDPAIFSRSLSSQLQTLVLLPLNYAAERADNTIAPVLIIVDGLDECDKSDDAHQEILNLLYECATTSRYPIRFLLASRPEWQIKKAFTGTNLASRSVLLALDEDYHADDDIRRFLITEFSKIKHRHPASGQLSQHWPSEYEITELVRKASRQFIYAATVMKFIDCDDDDPVERLKIILKISPVGEHTPYAQMDVLYSHILNSSIPTSNLEDTLKLLVFILLDRADKVPRLVAELLGYPQTRMTILLNGLNALVGVQQGWKSNQLIMHMYHASFGDFLFDQSRAGRLYVSKENAHERLVICWIRKAGALTSGGLDDINSYSMRDIGEQVVYHLQNIYLTGTLQEWLCAVNIAECLTPSVGWQIFDRFMDWLRENHAADMVQLYERRFGDPLRRTLEKQPWHIQPALAIFLTVPEKIPRTIIHQILTNLFSITATTQELIEADYHVLISIAELGLDTRSGIIQEVVSRIFLEELRSDRYIISQHDYAILAITTLNVPKHNDSDCKACIKFLSEILLPKAASSLGLATSLHRHFPHPHLLPWYEDKNWPELSPLLMTPELFKFSSPRMALDRCDNADMLVHAAWDYLERNKLTLISEHDAAPYENGTGFSSPSYNTQPPFDASFDSTSDYHTPAASMSWAQPEQPEYAEYSGRNDAGIEQDGEFQVTGDRDGWTEDHYSWPEYTQELVPEPGSVI